MAAPAQPAQDRPVLSPARLEEHQMTTINMFVDHNIDPECIVKATENMHNGVQGLLDEARSIVVVADAYQELYGIDVAALILFYKKYGQNVFEAHLNGLVHISQQGLLPPKQDGGNEATPAETGNDDLSATPPAPFEKKPSHLVTTGGKRLKPNPTHAQKTLPAPGKTIKMRSRALPMGKRPLTSSSAGKKSVQVSSAAKQKRTVAHLCIRSCPRFFIKRQAFINHALLKHRDKISGYHDLICCDETYGDETAYLDHQWEYHSEIVPAGDPKGGVTPREDIETPSSFSSSPGSDQDAGDY